MFEISAADLACYSLLCVYVCKNFCHTQVQHTDTQTTLHATSVAVDHKFTITIKFIHSHVLSHHVSKCSYTNLDMAFVYFLNRQQYISLMINFAAKVAE